MQKFFYLLIASGILFSACQDQATLDQMQATQAELAETKLLLASAQEQLTHLKTPANDLMHLVFFQLKKDHSPADVEALSTIVGSLSKVKSAKIVRVGHPTDTQDPRAKTDYQVALMVTFENVEQLAQYQQDQFHLDVKKQAGPYLSGPPVVYDFTLQ